MEKKAVFLKQEMTPLLLQQSAHTAARWGKMTYQQMIEHMTDAVRIASGKMPFTKIFTPPEHLEKMRAFIMSDKPFRENTVNPLLPEVPAPVKNPTIESAIEQLQLEINFFFEVFETNNQQITRNPVFGDLNFEQNVHLLYKHVVHHLKQFGVVV